MLHYVCVLVCARVQVGSWAGRVTKFPPAPPGKAPARNVPQIGG